MKNTCFKSERRPAMTDYPLILGENLFFSNTIHHIPRDVVLNFDFKRKLNSRCSYGENVVRILILRAGLRAKSLLSSKKKKKCLPTYSNFEFEKMGTKKFFYHGLISPNVGTKLLYTVSWPDLYYMASIFKASLHK